MRWVLIALAVSSAAACTTSAPRRVSRVTIGADATATARRLRMSCSWTRIATSRFEACTDATPRLSAYGRPASPGLVREGSHVAGVVLSFRPCTPADFASLRPAVVADLGLHTTLAEPYEVFGDDSLVKLDHDDDHCTLLVADSSYGKDWQGLALEGAIRNLVGAMQPH